MRACIHGRLWRPSKGHDAATYPSPGCALHLCRHEVDNITFSTLFRNNTFKTDLIQSNSARQIQESRFNWDWLIIDIKWLMGNSPFQSQQEDPLGHKRYWRTQRRASKLPRSQFNQVFKGCHVSMDETHPTTITALFRDPGPQPTLTKPLSI